MPPLSAMLGGISFELNPRIIGLSFLGCTLVTN